VCQTQKQAGIIEMQMATVIAYTHLIKTRTISGFIETYHIYCPTQFEVLGGRDRTAEWNRQAVYKTQVRNNTNREM
jgi:hypothetical protein